MSGHWDFDKLLPDKRIPYGFDYAVGLNQLHWHRFHAIFGYHSSVSTNVQSIGPTTTAAQEMYPYLTEAKHLKISSSSANDTAEGTGTQEIYFYGVDANYALVEERVELNGQTPVTSVNTYLRLFWAKDYRCGSNGGAVGDIYLASEDETSYTDGVPQTSSLILGKIPVGQGAYNGPRYTVPAGYILVLDELAFNLSGLNKSAQFFARARTYNADSYNNYSGWRDSGVYSTSVNGSTDVGRVYKTPPIFDEKTDLEILVKPDSTAAMCTGRGFFTLVSKRVLINTSA